MSVAEKGAYPIIVVHVVFFAAAMVEPLLPIWRQRCRHSTSSGALGPLLHHVLDTAYAAVGLGLVQKFAGVVQHCSIHVSSKLKIQLAQISSRSWEKHNTSVLYFPLVAVHM